MISLKNLPNRKSCPLASCGTCLPEIKTIVFNSIFKSNQGVAVDVPHCSKYGTTLATLDELAYVELKSCELYLQDITDKNAPLASAEADIIRKCLGLTKHEWRKEQFNYYDEKEVSLVAELIEPRGLMLHILSLVQKQIKLYEA